MHNLVPRRGPLSPPHRDHGLATWHCAGCVTWPPAAGGLGPQGLFRPIVRIMTDGHLRLQRDAAAECSQGGILMETQTSLAREAEQSEQPVEPLHGPPS